VLRARFADAGDVSADYQDLLGRGYVLRRYVNTLGWLSAINAEGRSDGLRLDSAISPVDRHVAWAILRRAAVDDPMYETARMMLVHELALREAIEDGELDHTLD
jgi:hypothetical protein